MNHTERIAETARRHRHLTRRMAKQAIETYLKLLAEEIAEGEWAEIYEIGKIQVTIEGGSGAERLRAHHRLRTKIRLGEVFKQQCYHR
jgi:nucleoid DNA-binding protein